MLGAIPPLPQYAFMAWCSKHRDNFTFTFYCDDNYEIKVVSDEKLEPGNLKFGIPK
jgi:hypothetical protein